jgi:hypothetical protein
MKKKMSNTDYFKGDEHRSHVAVAAGMNVASLLNSSTRTL